MPSQALAFKETPLDPAAYAANDDFFPPYSAVLAALTRSAGDPKLPTSFLRFLLSILLEGRPFDAEHYAAYNPDVVAAVEAGDTPSLHWHYVNVGYFEGRRGHLLFVDPDWYLSSYPDIARAYARGQIEDLSTHLNETGQYEGRTGSARQQAQRDAWLEQFGSIR